jgi:hypothetical protein
MPLGPCSPSFSFITLIIIYTGIHGTGTYRPVTSQLPTPTSRVEGSTSVHMPGVASREHWSRGPARRTPRAAPPASGKRRKRYVDDDIYITIPVSRSGSGLQGRGLPFQRWMTHSPLGLIRLYTALCGTPTSTTDVNRVSSVNSHTNPPGGTSD